MSTHRLVSDSNVLEIEITDRIPISTCGITDLIFVNVEGDDFLFTLAIDQRILVYAIHAEKIEFKRGLMTYVSDPASFVMKHSPRSNQKELVIVGNGMETIPLPWLH